MITQDELAVHEGRPSILPLVAYDRQSLIVNRNVTVLRKTFRMCKEIMEYIVMN